ncbi:NADPH:quinone reductase-like Zn-dependent oxidoreductase [Neolewinella xylanilytica]|uniref:NADPH:quinone reductase-like Zn-dependent oxidoreductase n=1 Tax=Neolewinella xylanilytica TaxID=1514080 RepID=A0A2S6I5X8_9BACT|nr:NADP-dependent oxidoreductase [Neolewinella xylanilytica]PPK86567.1 NADPH:quinone reductase-like Zn-dependent oxidoreductase [Neolewinella xylanilytica]
MKAIAYQSFGNVDVLRTVEVPTPTLRAGEVLVRVKAVSINPMDWKIRKGEMKLMSGSKFPRHLGVDFAGIVERTSGAVTGLKEGDAVFGVVKNAMKDGALSEYVAVPANLLWKKPTHLSFAQAASLPIVGTAAVTALHKMGNLTAQSSVLVNGATGGFGMLLLQLLQRTDAQVTAVAGPDTLPYATRWGADTVIDYAKEDVLQGTARYDVVVDLSGKLPYARAKRIMKSRARFLNATPQPIEIPTSLLLNPFRGKKHVVVLGSTSRENMRVLLDAVDAGLDVTVSRVFPFSHAVAAYRYAERGGVAGKVAIELP